MKLCSEYPTYWEGFDWLGKYSRAFLGLALLIPTKNLQKELPPARTQIKAFISITIGCVSLQNLQMKQNLEYGSTNTRAFNTLCFGYYRMKTPSLNASSPSSDCLPFKLLTFETKWPVSKEVLAFMSLGVWVFSLGSLQRMADSIVTGRKESAIWETETQVLHTSWEWGSSMISLDAAQMHWSLLSVDLLEDKRQPNL